LPSLLPSRLFQAPSPCIVALPIRLPFCPAVSEEDRFGRIRAPGPINPTKNPLRIQGTSQNPTEPHENTALGENGAFTMLRARVTGRRNRFPGARNRRDRRQPHDSAGNQVYLFPCALYVLNCLLFSLMRLSCGVF
jgi:hypothetical protein